jgi:hypothetical protein
MSIYQHDLQPFTFLYSFPVCFGLHIVVCLLLLVVQCVLNRGFCDEGGGWGEKEKITMLLVVTALWLSLHSELQYMYETHANGHAHAPNRQKWQSRLFGLERLDFVCQSRWCNIQTCFCKPNDTRNTSARVNTTRFHHGCISHPESIIPF